VITEKIKLFAEGIRVAFVASSDKSGMPHLAAFTGMRVADPGHIVFSEWFCPKTIENLAGNPAVAVAVMDSTTGKGYQFAGTVEKTSDIGILDGYDPDTAARETPQVLYELVVRVDSIMEFSHGVHTDRPI
jgi:predicted pyridoxine 5'-phosphate oxidase superfamily flavin-nucleotide-binding protein